MKWRAMIGAILLLATPVSVAHGTAGLDEVYEKPAGEKTWGEQVADFIGFGVYQKSYALVVGISRYTGGFDSLPTENDALRMKDFLLQEAGFDYVHVITEENVTPARISTVMLDEFRLRIDENDRFLFYWSGHGTDVPNAFGGMEGYLPVANSGKDQLGTMVSMADISEWDVVLRAGQALYLLDTCFSGLAVMPKASPRQLNIEQLAQPSHHIISAGTGDQKAIAGARWGGSLFTWAVLEGLRGAADTQNEYPRDGVVSLSELNSYLKTKVQDETQRVRWTGKLSPQLRDLRTNEGEFFFVTNRQKKAYARRQGEEPTGEFAHGLPVTKSRAVPPTRFDIEQLDVLMIVTASRVNVRAGPGTTYDKVGTLGRGQVINVIGKVGGKDWYRVALADGGTGYVLGRSLGESLPSPARTIDPAGVVAALRPPTPRPGEMLKDCDGCPEMVVVPAGSFKMGSPPDEEGRGDAEGPVRTIRIDQDFAVGRYEVTQEQYAAFVTATGHSSAGKCVSGWGFSGTGTTGWRLSGSEDPPTDQHPAVCVSWNDARAYAEWLTDKTGKTYRLLSEAEWEYAARAGTTASRFWGDDPADACSFANVRSLTGQKRPLVGYGRDNPFGWVHRCEDGEAGPAFVGSYRPNPFGLYDMLGNAWEWTLDCWNNDYDLAALNPAGIPPDGSAWRTGDCDKRVLRGGSWHGSPSEVRSANRVPYELDRRREEVGFRVARTLD